MLDTLSKHFAVISAIMLAAAATVTMLFFAIYLSVFDWGLIWLIEYPDLVKFFLLAAAAGSTTILLLLQFTPQMPSLLIKGTPFRWIYVCIFIGSVMAYPTYEALSQLSFSSAGMTFEPHKISKLFSYTLTLILVFVTLSNLDELRQRNIAKLSTVGSLFFICVGLYGLTHGLHVRFGTTQARTIVTKNETIKDARIIMMLSHHAALFVQDKVIVLPTSEIIRIETKVTSFSA